MSAYTSSEPAPKATGIAPVNVCANVMLVLFSMAATLRPTRSFAEWIPAPRRTSTPSWNIA